MRFDMCFVPVLQSQAAFMLIFCLLKYWARASLYLLQNAGNRYPYYPVSNLFPQGGLFYE